MTPVAFGKQLTLYRAAEARRSERRGFDDNGEPGHGEPRAAQRVVILPFSHRAVSARDGPQQIQQHIKLTQHVVRKGTHPLKDSNESRKRAMDLKIFSTLCSALHTECEKIATSPISH